MKITHLEPKLYSYDSYWGKALVLEKRNGTIYTLCSYGIPIISVYSGQYTKQANKLIRHFTDNDMDKILTKATLKHIGDFLFQYCSHYKNEYNHCVELTQDKCENFRAYDINNLSYREYKE